MSVSSDRQVMLVALGGAVAISFSPVIYVYSDTNPATGAFFRMLYALPALILLAYIARRDDSRSTRTRWMAFGAGAILAPDMLSYHSSMIFIGIGIATLLGNSQVIIVTLASWRLFGEPKSCDPLLLASGSCWLGPDIRSIRLRPLRRRSDKGRNLRNGSGILLLLIPNRIPSFQQRVGPSRKCPTRCHRGCCTRIAPPRIASSPERIDRPNRPPTYLAWPCLVGSASFVVPSWRVDRYCLRLATAPCCPHVIRHSSTTGPYVNLGGFPAR